MKRILCPKCDNYITFDETKYTEGQSLVFICEHCKKQFSIRIGKTKAGAVLEVLLLIGILLVCTAYLVDGTYTPFLYFRF